MCGDVEAVTIVIVVLLLLTGFFRASLQPPNMGSMMTTTQPSMMYNQAAMRPANPFGPGAQVMGFGSTGLPM